MAAEEPPPLGDDHHRLLALIACYTAPQGDAGGRWLKELALQVAVFDLIRAGVFAHYDHAPTLIPCHGTRRFAQTSQEAFNDLRYLRKRRLVDRVRLSTRYHDIAGAFRVSSEGLVALATAPSGLVEAVRARLACPRCGAAREPVVLGRDPEAPAGGPRGAGAQAGASAAARATRGSGLTAAWLCSACCARCGSAGATRPVDPRRCAHCRGALVEVPFFSVETVAFATRSHLPARAAAPAAGTAASPKASDREARDARLRLPGGGA